MLAAVAFVMTNCGPRVPEMTSADWLPVVSVRLTPPFCHWYVGAGVPVTTAEKTAVDPEFSETVGYAGLLSTGALLAARVIGDITKARKSAGTMNLWVIGSGVTAV